MPTPVERIPQSTAIRVAFQAYLSADHVSPATGKTIPITISKNGAAYGNPSGGATNATEIANGSYYVDLSTTDTATAGPLLIYGTAASTDNINLAYRVVDANNAGFLGVPSAVAGASNGLLINGTNSGTVTLAAVSVSGGLTVSGTTSLGAVTVSGTTSLAAVTTSGTLTLNALTISNNLTVTGTTTHTGNVTLAAGLTITQSAANSTALVVTGNGTGNGATFTSGSGLSGTGLAVLSNATNGPGLTVTGKGTGNGATFTSGSGSSGNAVNMVAASTNGSGLYCLGHGTGVGLSAIGGATGDGAAFEGGGGTASGLYCFGGSSGGAGILAQCGGGDGAGMLMTGNGAGNGLTVTGGSTDAAAIYLQSFGNGSGLEIEPLGGNGIWVHPGTGDGIVVESTNNGFTVQGTTIGFEVLGPVLMTNASNDVRGIKVSSITNGAITSSTFAADSITSTVLAADCIGSSELAASAVTKIAAAINGSGGANAITITVTDGTNPLQNVNWSVYDNGNALVGTGFTDASGHGSLSANNGTYTVALVKSGYTFTPTTCTVTGIQAGTLVNNLVMTPVAVPSAPTDPTLCTVYGYIVNSQGVPLQGVKLKVTPVSQNAVQSPIVTTGGYVFSFNTVEATSNGSGYVACNVVRTDNLAQQVTYDVTTSDGQINKSLVTFTTATQNIATL